MRIPRISELRELGDQPFMTDFGLAVWLGFLVDALETAGVTDDDLPESIPDEVFAEYEGRQDEDSEALAAEFLNRFAPAVAAKLGFGEAA